MLQTQSTLFPFSLVSGRSRKSLRVEDLTFEKVIEDSKRDYLSLICQEAAQFFNNYDPTEHSDVWELDMFVSTLSRPPDREWFLDKGQGDVRRYVTVIFLLTRQIINPSPPHFISLEHFLRIFPQFEEFGDVEKMLLFEYGNWVYLAYETMPFNTNATILLRTVTDITEGALASYKTGGGKSKGTIRRQLIIRKIGDLPTTKRKGGKRRSKVVRNSNGTIRKKRGRKPKGEKLGIICSKKKATSTVSKKKRKQKRKSMKDDDFVTQYSPESCNQTHLFPFTINPPSKPSTQHKPLKPLPTTPRTERRREKLGRVGFFEPSLRTIDEDESKQSHESAHFLQQQPSDGYLEVERESETTVESETGYDSETSTTSIDSFDEWMVVEKTDPETGRVTNCGLPSNKSFVPSPVKRRPPTPYFNFPFVMVEPKVVEEEDDDFVMVEPPKPLKRQRTRERREDEEESEMNLAWNPQDWHIFMPSDVSSTDYNEEEEEEDKISILSDTSDLCDDLLVDNSFRRKHRFSFDATSSFDETTIG